MPTGVYERKPCAPGCTCRKHTRAPFTAETRARISASAKIRGANHSKACACGWCSQRGKRSDDPGYRAIHARLHRERGTPSLCARCGTTTAARYDWAYTGPGHLRGSGQPFSENLDDYIRLCRACHQKFDKGGD